MLALRTEARGGGDGAGDGLRRARGGFALGGRTAAALRAPPSAPRGKRRSCRGRLAAFPCRCSLTLDPECHGALLDPRTTRMFPLRAATVRGNGTLYRTPLPTPLSDSTFPAQPRPCRAKPVLRSAAARSRTATGSERIESPRRRSFGTTAPERCGSPASSSPAPRPAAIPAARRCGPSCPV